jgi:hypothetical protein
MAAKSKAEATARMYELAGEPVESLGPGSKEKRSALEALGRVVGLDVTTARTKIECGRQIAERLDVIWDVDCYSSGDSITLVGLNRLLGEADRNRSVAPSEQVPHSAKQEVGVEQVSADDLERRVAESISELTRSIDAPDEVAALVEPVDLDGIRFDDGSWRTHLASVAGWLHLAVDLDLTSDEHFDASLARGLGLDDGWAVGEVDAFRALLVPRLADRLDRALALREEFVSTLESVDEVGGSRQSASAAWSESWAEVEEEEEAEGSGPIHAEADTWAITDFVSYAREDELNLSPSYQRADVWPTSSSQLLVESILRGIPLPSIIILERVDDDRTSYEVVDGKQRLTSILRFIGCHPRAVELVREKAEQWDEPDLLITFQQDYPTFKKLWKKNETARLTAQLERTLYFPFPLRSGDVKPLSGELAPLRGRYYCQIRHDRIRVLGQPRQVRYIFEQTSNYKLPVIVYKEVTSEQIHEVFSLYNKQGKHLNAEEIRNALYHHLAFMKALVVTAGDSGTVEGDAPFLDGRWADLASTQVVLDRYGFGQAGYKRTKLLSWVSSVLLLEDGSPERRSTANHINALLKRVEGKKSDVLRNEDKVREAMVVLDKGLDAHATIPPDVWAKQFVNSQNRGRWQELQLVASLIGLSAAYVVHGDDLSDVVAGKLDALETASASWERPRKTQSREQWRFIAEVVAGLLDVLEAPSDVADANLREQFGASGLKELVALRNK